MEEKVGHEKVEREKPDDGGKKSNDVKRKIERNYDNGGRRDDVIRNT